MQYKPESTYHQIIINNNIRKYGKEMGRKKGLEEIARIGRIPYFGFNNKTNKELTEKLGKQKWMSR